MSVTLCKRRNGDSWFQLALHVTVFGTGCDLISQLTVICVWIDGEEFLLRDQVCGLTSILEYRQNISYIYQKDIVVMLLATNWGQQCAIIGQVFFFKSLSAKVCTPHDLRVLIYVLRHDSRNIKMQCGPF